MYERHKLGFQETEYIRINPQKHNCMFRTVVNVLTKCQGNQNQELTRGFWESFAQNATLRLALRDDLELKLRERVAYYTEKNKIQRLGGLK